MKFSRSYLLDPQSVSRWSKILITLPHRSGLESLLHNVTDGNTILSKGKVSTTDFIGFSYQSASLNHMRISWNLYRDNITYLKQYFFFIHNSLVNFLAKVMYGEKTFYPIFLQFEFLKTVHQLQKVCLNHRK